MATEIKAPTFPESVQEGSLATWHKKVGDTVARDELLVDIETDKVVLEVVAPVAGVLSEILKLEGDSILSNEVIARIEEGATASAPVAAAAIEEEPETTASGSLINPAARKLAEERGIDAAQITGTGKGGRITKEDVVNFTPSAPVAKAAAPAPTATAAVVVDGGDRVERRVPMTRMRSRIAERLLEVTQTTASLTTFNEVDMTALMDLRKQYKDEFTKIHNGTRLGFMGFFVKAAVEALKRFPSVNASIDGTDIVYHGYQDVGVAVSTERGLVVPVLRNAENMSIANIENGIYDYAMKARDGKLTIEEMSGGTFTITNGGVYGSLISTPIINPPQSAILGMHKIQERPMAVNGQVVIRPMMYLALSYDHRLIDGKGAVQFLVTIKELIEDPAKILLEI
ncbi:MAG: 2-oxoglutarate dehydrogenase complex dihydrolipoyllysine-residue succinyltransferase [Porticoccaceae bacterium]|jgi:2-oxoglutarate dehydrogenase E2 component (dihydrolipoamide succinyltransferase)|nr:MAG: dihydrolipoamide succinyltransferase [SAR92 bacterium BACL16 MAG-120619-bin48]MDP4653687.1 2-oxoglutarate dehydrogenase complex dihydrolipoyllysine-residue succinyltransferase [Alphaproteobacteria bacterium]MDP4745752.1 2-oxoglutarate dehydrogenase complex dihydrolipoyllysine-residue succinyltransferase [Porticoccaceae bacterium]MDP4752863.1 2-oxoglutarate dehydrogenase complex dihydrolipoyllysine-residue succinyltransferase [Porticoccaceae bacterium]MDP4889645.1 2-oxoglutarate dehydrog